MNHNYVMTICIHFRIFYAYDLCIHTNNHYQTTVLLITLSYMTKLQLVATAQ